MRPPADRFAPFRPMAWIDGFAAWAIAGAASLAEFMADGGTAAAINGADAGTAGAADASATRQPE